MGSSAARRVRWAVLLALAWVALGSLPPPAGAHVVLSRATLRQSLQHSALSVRARFLGDPRIERVAGGDRQEVQRLRIEEVLARRGASGAGTGLPDVGAELDVFFHAEGMPSFPDGASALVFLERTSERPEFAALAPSFPWYSVQGPGDEWILAGDDGARILDQARAWRAWVDDPGADFGGLRSILLAGLDSGVERLQADSMAELLRISGRPGFLDAPGASEAFARRVGDAALPFSRRIALLHWLEPSLGPGSGALWARLLAGVSGEADTVALAGLAGADPDPAVALWLRQRVDDPSQRVRRAVWRAIARSASAEDVGLLARGSRDADPAVARAAIQGLGSLSAPAARSQLEALAGSEPPERARWARAALRRTAEGAHVR